MTEQQSATAVTVTIAVLATGGVPSVFTGLYPGALLLVAAVILTVAQRSNLARAIRTPGATRRRRRLTIAAVLAVSFAAALVSYFHDLSDDHISTASLLVHNAIGVPLMLGALVFLIAGLLTPSTPNHDLHGTPVA